MMKRSTHIIFTFSTLLLLFVHNKAFANAAQPGIWNAGGTVFTMLYPQDSLTFKKVQMLQERIYIQLYKGYAVVKGTYLFRNTTGEPLNFKMGYPVNGIYYGGEVDLNEVTLDSLSQFKIRAKNKWLTLPEKPNTEYGNIRNFSNNWKVWDMAFAPNESQTVEVYFIVNTNNAQVRKGYNTKNRNAFIYLLESGSVWHQPIEKGNFYVQLMDGLISKDLQGLSSGFGFQYNKMHQLFAGVKTSFSPTSKDNLVITYYEYNEKFSLGNIVTRSDSLFTKIDELSLLPLETFAYTKVETGDPYEVKGALGSSFTALLTLFIIYAPFIIGITVVVIAIWAILKWIKIRRRKNKGV